MVASTQSLELEALKKAKAGDMKAFAELITMYQDSIYNYLRMMLLDEETARDLTQEAFTRALETLSCFNSSMPFRPWIYRIAHNLAIDAIRKRSGESAGGKIEEKPEELVREPFTPFELAGADETKIALLKALAKMRPAEREALVMKHYEDLTYEEMAEITGLPINALRIRVMRARRTACELLKEMGISNE